MSNPLSPGEMPPATENVAEAPQPPNPKRPWRLPQWMKWLTGGRSQAAEKSPITANGNGTIEEQHALMKQNIMQLHDRKVADVMTPRADIVAIELNTELRSLLKVIVDNPFSRLPVYRSELDDVLGFIHIKDILDSLVTETEFDLGRLIRETGGSGNAARL